MHKQQSTDESKYDLREYILKVRELEGKVRTPSMCDSFNNAADIRRTFYSWLANNLRQYWLALSLPYLADVISKDCVIVPTNGLCIGSVRRLKPDDEVITDAIKHLLLSHLSACPDVSALEDYVATQRRILFVEAWNTFESALRVLYEVAIPSETKEQVKASVNLMYSKPKVDVHIPVMRIWNEVSKLSEREEVRKQLGDFIEFISLCRNTIHSNSFYNGRLTEYRLHRRPLKLVPGEPVDFLNADVILEILNKLKDAFDLLARQTRGIEVVLNPVHAMLHTHR